MNEIEIFYYYVLPPAALFSFFYIIYLLLTREQKFLNITEEFKEVKEHSRIGLREYLKELQHLNVKFLEETTKQLKEVQKETTFLKDKLEVINSTQDRLNSNLQNLQNLQIENKNLKAILDRKTKQLAKAKNDI